MQELPETQEGPSTNYAMLRRILDKFGSIENASAKELELIAFELEHATSQAVTCLVEKAMHVRARVDFVKEIISL